MFRNLQAEFARLNQKPCKALAEVLGCTERACRNKLNGTTEITMSEAQKIKARYFPDLTLDYLFEVAE